jgi:RNA polymerase sigma factor (sigma-70 family)
MAALTAARPVRRSRLDPPAGCGERRRRVLRRRHGERALVLAAQGGDTGAREELVDAFMPLIGSVARLYRGVTAVHRAELMQAGVAGLLTALERFEPSRCTPFWTYASWWVRQAMQQVVAELARPVVISDRGLRELARMRAARREFVRLDGAGPSSARLAAATGMTRERIETLLAVELVPDALESEPAWSDEDDLPHRNGHTLEDPGAEEAFDRVLDRIECDRISRLIEGLHKRERVILRARFGLDGQERTLRETGRIVGLSAERVRQLEHEALDELRAVATTA